MQVKKEQVKQKILDSAEIEFLENGFEKASLRTIAQRCKVTKGSIYTYFDSKDALFLELTKPAVEFFDNWMRIELCEEHLEEMVKQTQNNVTEYGIKSTTQWASEILKDYNRFKLLFFCSSGSSVGNYREDIIQMYAKQHKYYYESLGEQLPEFKTHVSEMLIHTLASLYISIIEELILHNPNKDELDEYIEQVSVFVNLGINQMLIHQGSKQKKLTDSKSSVDNKDNKTNQ